MASVLNKQSSNPYDTGENIKSCLPTARPIEIYNFGDSSLRAGSHPAPAYIYLGRQCSSFVERKVRRWWWKCLVENRCLFLHRIRRERIS